MSLFENSPPDADQGYLNIRAAERDIERTIRDALEALWDHYEPYSDTDFRQNFARQPDARFWEMYLTVQLLEAGKNVCPRSELRAADRDTGPDIRIVEGDYTIWIEARTPEPGEPANPDHVPEIIPINEGGGAQPSPRRQVELRITGALIDKRDAFERYRRQGIIAENDICVVAVSGANFFAQSATAGLPLAVTAVYPFGDEYVTINRETLDVVDSGYHYSENIDRSDATPIPRYAFLDEHFSRVSGLVWSRRTIGNFFFQPHDFIFVHNFAAEPEFPRGWLEWAEEDVIDEAGDQLELTRLYPRDEDAGV